MLNNPIVTIFGGLDQVGKGLSVVKGTFSVLWLQLKIKWWYNEFPGLEKLLTDVGREWILQGLTLAAEAAKLTENEVDDLIINKIQIIINSSAGWNSIKTIINIAIESSDVVRGTESGVGSMAGEALSTCLIDDAANLLEISKDVCGEDDTSEDPLTVLYIILICLQIAQKIRMQREKTRTERDRIRKFFRKAESEFIGKVVQFKR